MEYHVVSWRIMDDHGIAYAHRLYHESRIMRIMSYHVVSACIAGADACIAPAAERAVVELPVLVAPASTMATTNTSIPVTATRRAPCLGSWWPPRRAQKAKDRGGCVEEEGQGECVEEEGQGGTWGGMCHTPPQSRPNKARPAISVQLSSFICVFVLKL